MLNFKRVWKTSLDKKVFIGVFFEYFYGNF